MDFSAIHSSSVKCHAICLFIEKFPNATELVYPKSKHLFKKEMLRLSVLLYYNGLSPY